MPDPVLVAVAAALAGRAAGNVYDLVKGKLQGRRGAVNSLEAAGGAPAGSPAVHELATVLEAAEREDPVFSEALRSEWQKYLTAQHTGGTTNVLSGSVAGKVVQARDIHGDVNL